MRNYIRYIRRTDLHAYTDDLNMLRKKYTAAMTSDSLDAIVSFQRKSSQFISWWNLCDSSGRRMRRLLSYEKSDLDAKMHEIEAYVYVPKGHWNVFGSNFIARYRRPFVIKTPRLTIDCFEGREIAFTCEPARRYMFWTFMYERRTYALFRAKGLTICNANRSFWHSDINKCRLTYRGISDMVFSYHICDDTLTVHKRYSDDTKKSASWRPDYGTCDEKNSSRWQELYVMRRRIVHKMRWYNETRCELIEQLPLQTLAKHKNFMRPLPKAGAAKAPKLKCFS